MPDDRPDLLDLVRQRCRQVARQAESVRIDDDRLVSYAATLVPGGGPTGPGDPTVSDPDPWAVAGGDEEDRVALVLALDAINFGSGYHPLVTKLDGLSGARTMATRLRRWADREGAVRAGRLATLDRAEVHRLFGQPETAEMVELMGAFTRSLNELGRTVVDRFDGSFAALVASAGGSAARLVATLAELPTYADVSSYRGLDVPFLKRAQITAADLNRAFDGAGPGALGDIDRLTAFADNLVPHVLRVDGVLELDPELAAHIDAGQLLVHGDEPEVELRACGVEAVERLRAALLARGVERTSASIDQALWARGGGARYKAVARPRARSTAY